ncbi:hypothetical protein LTS08_002562 [Lithohypha guttulata]|uniref:uncharacterized protein n=1 Tax=Lithohypha guttulata TaxID=1690604 RepID=UPI002DDF3DD9|nr:hypothetical protein LTR51_001732 [Lithohypha guttulata]KAK5104671.1 hypothetical protein LTS08_002562 [Lithohypha guttulata]
MSANDSEPHLRDGHPFDKYGAKLVEKAGHLQEKVLTQSKKDEQKKGPAGGFDNRPVPQAPPGYTVRIIFHRAENLPFSDFATLSTDPYIHATFKTDLVKRNKQDPDLYLRTPTIHRNTKPKWETQWVIAHVPASGFHLKCRLYDEDPSDHDDRLGNVHIVVDRISDSWPGIKEEAYDLKKRMGSKRAYTFRGAASILRRGLKMSAQLIVSIESLGRSPGDDGGRSYTVAPLPWSRHHSPLIGRIAGTKDREESSCGKKSVERYNFQAIQMQLTGPVPAPMYHRYVEFRPFIAGMFTDVTLRGRILNRALHHQHARVYNYDTSTTYGIFEKPCLAMTKQFLEFVHYDQGGRIYTYVLSLDGLWRFTETGKEFGIDMLSKHTMHSDVSIYIAFSGEFFVRRLKHQDREQNDNTDLTDRIAPPSADPENSGNPSGRHSHGDIPKDPSHYELIIDNDSGTYRPNAELLPLLKEYMAMNLPGLRVATLDCQKDEKKMKKLKEEQVERKKRSGKQITYMQNSSMSSLSSSDEEELEARALGQERPNAYKRKVAKGQSKMQAHAHKDSAKKESIGQEHAYLSPERHNNNEYVSDRDSRDMSSSLSSGEHVLRSQRVDNREGLRNTNESYASRDLPTLLKKDTNGHVPQPQTFSEHEPEHPYVEPETGDHKPAGGIVYNGVISTAGVERSCRPHAKHCVTNCEAKQQ